MNTAGEWQGVWAEQRSYYNTPWVNKDNITHSVTNDWGQIKRKIKRQGVVHIICFYDNKIMSV